MTTVIVFATGATIGYEYFMRAIWNFNNKGKLWKDIKDNYAEEE
eukprot:CAMPEP_0181192940 /NCGR_PEP_ID=MMETSP1096-20121128/13552_1 /TAXON_ID=156174 ORGANISM="Chrysochromulina ericina, Strain CCMP281" /NCGR_SAMPLE_ID=MMETSP1096 /ASSEMBLY_ACC=CAM_ASM_000453 /LENGTH=43 /DNA_ID= /DNA_START= /DNA_END= /DNA_ORIENTATION=